MQSTLWMWPPHVELHIGQQPPKLTTTVWQQKQPTTTTNTSLTCSGQQWAQWELPPLGEPGRAPQGLTVRGLLREPEEEKHHHCTKSTKLFTLYCGDIPQLFEFGHWLNIIIAIWSMTSSIISSIGRCRCRFSLQQELFMFTKRHNRTVAQQCTMG